MRIVSKTASVPGGTKVDQAEGIIEFFPSVTGNVDMQKDRIIPGAYRDFLGQVANGQQKMPKITLNHQVGSDGRSPQVLGKILAMAEWLPGDRRLPASLQSKSLGALWAKAQFNLETQLARETWSNLKFGALDEFSIMFGVEDPSDEFMTRDGVRELKRIFPVIEMGPVFLGANRETALLSVKSGYGQPASLTQLLVKAAVELAVQRLERHARRQAVFAEVAEAVPELLNSIVTEAQEKRQLDAEIQRRTQTTVWKAQPRPAPRPLTEREQFERDIARRAGILAG